MTTPYSLRLKKTIHRNADRAKLVDGDRFIEVAHPLEHRVVTQISVRSPAGGRPGAVRSAHHFEQASTAKLHEPPDASSVRRV